jgi:hypothetical protein
MSEAPAGHRSAADGSSLCLSCGLCCDGSLLRDVRVYPDERPAALGLRLTLIDDGTRLSFALPCPLFKDNRCSVYDERPRSCRAFRCGLLRKLDRGEITLERARQIVSTTRQLLLEERASSGNGIETARLNVYLLRHFEPPTS